ncbi:hypothetical protein L602_002800000580 [Cupriavidus gilardii J11]|uniref:PIN domain-containing protein n=1 Tax=Cupriavidus gilardii J11 TaxID=936133 RepID=A0A562BH22_9BURK|nr:type II toxin-antitoxin system VapC family toxin [Cupriavidus gilardii]TWG84259.1 hypothetical protein L602_002800000580 [Cupriavidus gilardii J11]
MLRPLGRGGYGHSRDGIAHVVQGLLNCRELIIEASDIVRRAWMLYATSKADFADCLIERRCHAAECHRTMTFDVNAARTAGFQLLQ